MQDAYRRDQVDRLAHAVDEIVREHEQQYPGALAPILFHARDILEQNRERLQRPDVARVRSALQNARSARDSFAPEAIDQALTVIQEMTG